MRVLVVCHGNVNRSPLCAAILRRERPDWEVREAALKSWKKPAWKPERASKKMRDAALELGINLEEHRSTAISEELLRWAQVIVYMDQGNYKRLSAMVDELIVSGYQMTSLGSYASVGRIPDPAFIARGTREFHDVVQLIDRASRSLAKDLIVGEF